MYKHVINGQKEKSNVSFEGKNTLQENTGQSCLALKSVMLHLLIGGQSPGIMDGFFIVKKQKLSNFPKQVEGDGVGHLYFDSLTLPHNYPNYK